MMRQERGSGKRQRARQAKLGARARVRAYTRERAGTVSTMGQLMKRVIVAMTALVVVLATAAAAQAHASLRTSVPGDGTVVARGPGEVALGFSEQITFAPSAVQVFGPSNDAVQTGSAAYGRSRSTIVQHVRATAPGTYYVAYHITSADGHTVGGTVSFSVGHRSDANASKGSAGAAVTENRAAALGAGLARFVEFMSLLAAVGGVLFASVIAPSWSPRGVPLVLMTLLVGLAGAFVCDAAITQSVGLGNVLSGTVLRAEVSQPYGRAALITAGLTVLALVSLPLLRSGTGPGEPALRSSRVAVGVVFCALAASVSLTGHAIVTSPVAVRLPLDMVHVLAAAIWLGGLIQMASMVPNARDHVADVQRFSNVAFAAVLVLLATGVYATYTELGLSWHAVSSTRYGHIVLAKLVLYAGTMPLAALNKTSFVPAVERRPQDASAMLRQYVVRELLLLVVVVALTAWLVGSDPHGLAH
jgi:copper transport protein